MRALEGPVRQNGRRPSRFAIAAVTAILAFGLGATSTPGERAPCRICFYGPDNMVFDRDGNLYVTDTDGRRHSRVVKIAPDGKPVAQWHIFAAQAGKRNGPEGIAMTASGTILVTDAGIERILEVSPQGRVLRSFGGTEGAFKDLGHVAVDPAGNVYVAQAEPNVIEKYSAAGALLDAWHRSKGPGVGEWGGPETIATQPDGHLVVEDWGNRRIEIFDSSGTMLLAFGHLGNGPGEFRNTAGLGVDGDGDIYVTDVALHRVQKFDARGRLLATIANTPGAALFAKGPSAIAIDRQGSLYSPDGQTVVKYSQDGKLLARWQ